MGCCGSSEGSESIKKDKQQFEIEATKNVQNGLEPCSPHVGGCNKIQPFQEDNKQPINDSKFDFRIIFPFSDIG